MRAGPVAVGLVPRVRQALADHGYKVTLTDHRIFGNKFAINKDFFRVVKGEDRRLLDTVRREPVGQIEVNGFRDMIAVMRMIIYLYPDAHILIPVATNAMARKIRWKLNAAALDFEAELGGRNWPRIPPRCMVCTFESMHGGKLDDWNIILLPDPQGAVGNWSIRAMAHLHGNTERDAHRVYSFATPGLRLGRRGRIRLETISGAVIYRLGAKHVGVRVLWMPSPDCAAIDNDMTALAFKRAAYWHNSNRNDFVAAVARAFVNHDFGKLAEYGVPVRNGKAALRHGSRAKIAVLTASTEQAREMAKRSPGWKIMDAAPHNGKKTAEPGGNRMPSSGIIITEAAAKKKGLDADVVIRAGGGTGILCFNDFPPARDTVEKKDVIVVDFRDTFHQRAVQDGNRRRREYKMLGWESETEHVEATVAERE